MNWDAIAAVGELIGAAAVVASLLYLAIQTKSNAKAVRANAIWNAETVFGHQNYAHSRDPAMASLLSKAFSPSSKVEDFSEVELSQLQFYVRGVLQYQQAQWSLWQEGTLPTEICDRRRKWVSSYVDIPVINAIWRLELDQYIVSDGFRADIESIHAEHGLKLGIERE